MRDFEETNDDAWLDETSSFHTDSDSTMRNMNLDDVEGGTPPSDYEKVSVKTRRGAGPLISKLKNQAR